MYSRRERLLGVGQDTEGNTAMTGSHICSPARRILKGTFSRLASKLGTAPLASAGYHVIAPDLRATAVRQVGIATTTSI